MSVWMDVIIAIITGILAVVGAYVGNVAVSRKKSHEDALRDREREIRQDERMKKLEEKIDKHNSYGDKIGKIQGDIREINARLASIEKGLR